MDRVTAVDNQFFIQAIFSIVNLALIVFLIIFIVFVFRASVLYIKNHKNKLEQKFNNDENDDKTI